MRHSAQFPPLQNFENLFKVELTVFPKPVRRLFYGGQRPLRGRWGFALGRCLSTALAKSPAFLPLLLCASPHFTASETQSADPHRAKPHARSFAPRGREPAAPGSPATPWPAGALPPHSMPPHIKMCRPSAAKPSESASQSHPPHFMCGGEAPSGRLGASPLQMRRDQRSEIRYAKKLCYTQK